MMYFNYYITSLSRNRTCTVIEVFPGNEKHEWNILLLSVYLII